MADYDDMTARELRQEIINRVGVNGNRYTALTKPTLNSLAAYLQGMFPIDPDQIYLPTAPNSPHIREMINDVTGLESDTETSYTRDELQTILERMDETGDKRDWSGEHAELTAE